MKNQILDVPFRNSFPDFLGKDETIVWEGKPTYQKITVEGNPLVSDDGYENYIIWAILILATPVLFWISNFNPLAFLMVFLYTLILIFLPWWQNRKFNNTRYAITQHQILFQFKNRLGKNSEFHSIPFADLKDIMLIKTYDFERMAKDSMDGGYSTVRYSHQKKLEKMGTIFLIPHQPELIPFETKNLTNNNKRHQPTLELLDDVEAVAKLIREGIRKNVK